MLCGMDAELICVACESGDDAHHCEPVPLSVALVELLTTQWRTEVTLEPSAA